MGSPKMIFIPRGVYCDTAGSSAAPLRRATNAGPAGIVIG
jgi:hypothetical protein